MSDEAAVAATRRRALMRFLSNPVTWIFLAAVASACAGYFTLKAQDKQANETKGWLTGADGYAYLEPKLVADHLVYFIRHSGDYPVYDVTVIIQDANHVPLYPPIPFGTLSSNIQWRGLEELRFPRVPTASDAPKSFRVELAARNGVTVQYLRMEPGKNRWLTRSKPIKRSDKEELHPKDFPEEELR